MHDDTQTTTAQQPDVPAAQALEKRLGTAQARAALRGWQLVRPVPDGPFLAVHGRVRELPDLDAAEAFAEAVSA